MGRVRGRDSHEIDGIFAPRFALQHFAPVAIGPVGGKPEPAAVIAPLVRPVVERAGHEIELPVNKCTKPVSRADLAALAASDHPPTQSAHVASRKFEQFPAGYCATRQHASASRTENSELFSYLE